MTPVRRASAAYFVYFIGIGALWPYLPVYYRQLGLDLGAIGLLAAIAAFVSLIASPVWGWLNDRFPESRLVLASAPAIAAVAGLALALAVGLPAIVVCVVVLYLAMAGIGPMLDARTVDMLGADRTRYGRVRAWGSASFVFASLLVGVLIDRTSVASLFEVWVPAVALAAVVMLMLPTRPRGRSVSLFRGAADLLGRRDLALFLGASLLVFSALAAANSFFSVYVVSLGEPAQLVGLAWAVGSVVEVAVMWTFPTLAGRVGLPALLVLGSAGFAVRAVGVALVTSPAACWSRCSSRGSVSARSSRAASCSSRRGRRARSGQLPRGCSRACPGWRSCWAAAWAGWWRMRCRCAGSTRYVGRPAPWPPSSRGSPCGRRGPGHAPTRGRRPVR
jgi:MFS transporter, PPP family, 3-phenylpropionic acid transporter